MKKDHNYLHFEYRAIHRYNPGPKGPWVISFSLNTGGVYGVPLGAGRFIYKGKTDTIQLLNLNANYAKFKRSKSTNKNKQTTRTSGLAIF
jgi:hypothetical protein